MKHDIARIDFDCDREFPVIGVALVLVGQWLIWLCIGYLIGSLL